MSIVDYAKEKYSGTGADADKALKALEKISISLHCWQGDDVGGFENPDGDLSGGIQATGNFPGKARTIDELKKDLEKVYSLLPGKHRLSLHAIYGDFSEKKADRNQIEVSHFQTWIDWARENGLGLDFNATLFSHPLSDSGFTLSDRSKSVRDFWIEHCIRVRKIGEESGRQLGTPSVHNLWIPDGSKDFPADRMGYRTRLKESLDEIYKIELDEKYMRDAVESKLFGIGSETFTVGSHEFYMGYALTRKKILCLDMGHFHPTELIADKISSVFQFQNELLLHVSRPVRWDSDHVVVLNDDLYALALELVRSGKIMNTYIGLDFFDASINRIGAWTIGTRSTLKAILFALLEPTEQLIEMEKEGNLFGRLALLEQLKTMPFGIIWDEYCEHNNVPKDSELSKIIMDYEKNELSKRD